MKVQFISNACAIFESNSGTKIITDPWLDDGVFEGSWCHFHKLKTRWEDIQDVDAVYVSHVHPDHYDERFFNFRKDIPILVMDHGFNFLHKNLTKAGYTNLIKIKDGEAASSISKNNPLGAVLASSFGLIFSYNSLPPN